MRARAATIAVLIAVMLFGTATAEPLGRQPGRGAVPLQGGQEGRVAEREPSARQKTGLAQGESGDKAGKKPASRGGNEIDWLFIMFLFLQDGKTRR